MDTEQRKYEIAYLISPEVSDEEVFGEAGKITTAIQDRGGLIDRIEEPKKRRLAFMIKNFRNGFFGWTTFSMAPEKLAEFKKTIDASAKTIFRYLITETEKLRVMPQKYPRLVARPKISDAPKHYEYAAKQPPVESAGAEEKMNIEELDKKLEEILGK
ncbi:30S ribosomal protein S6 [Patescibacteria group bacterium]|nr:30S ribosomal protein S6 [Patescibacteria group bacterium]